MNTVGAYMFQGSGLAPPPVPTLPDFLPHPTSDLRPRPHFGAEGPQRPFGLLVSSCLFSFLRFSCAGMIYIYAQACMGHAHPCITSLRPPTSHRRQKGSWGVTIHLPPHPHLHKGMGRHRPPPTPHTISTREGRKRPRGWGGGREPQNIFANGQIWVLYGHIRKYAVHCIRKRT